MARTREDLAEELPNRSRKKGNEFSPLMSGGPQDREMSPYSQNIHGFHFPKQKKLIQSFNSHRPYGIQNHYSYSKINREQKGAHFRESQKGSIQELQGLNS
mmetsp:Transcript_3242/g.3191  ORF Transcript_3242/g.3191 Transcript_3242/m.3191 type:complete len:101 (+) Transcript_3242:2408-2710(+)